MTRISTVVVIIMGTTNQNVSTSMITILFSNIRRILRVRTPSTGNSSTQRSQRTTRRVTGLRFFLGVRVVGNDNRVRHLPQIALRVIHRNTHLISSGRTLTKNSNMMTSVVTYLFRHLLGLLSLITSQLTGKLDKVHARSLLVTGRNINAVIRRRYTTGNNIKYGQRTKRLPPRSIYRARTYRVQRFRVQYTLGSVSTNVYAAIHQTCLERVERYTRAGTVRRSRGGLSRVGGASFPVVPRPNLPIQDGTLPTQIFPQAIPLPPPPNYKSRGAISKAP